MEWETGGTAPVLGVLTGIGGGMLRDILLSEIPIVLRAELYAVTALAGAVVVVIGHLIAADPTGTAILGATVCFCLRLAAIRRHWQLPRARLPPEEE